MFIDIHVHTRTIPGPPLGGKQAFATPEQLLARYEPIGVEAAVLLPGVSPECSHVPQSNEEILEVCKRYPGRFIPFCNVDPRAMTHSSDAPLGDILTLKEQSYADRKAGRDLFDIVFILKEQKAGFGLVERLIAKHGAPAGMDEMKGMALNEDDYSFFRKVVDDASKAGN